MSLLTWMLSEPQDEATSTRLDVDNTFLSTEHREGHRERPSARVLSPLSPPRFRPDTPESPSRSTTPPTPTQTTRAPSTLYRRRKTSVMPSESSSSASATATATASTPGPSSRDSFISATSTTLSYPSTTSTLRRFWSPSPSSPSSPPSTSPSTFTATTRVSYTYGSLATSPKTAHPRPPASHAVLYIPPLVDSAGGTLPRRQRGVSSAPGPPALSPWRLLWSDLRWLWCAAPELLHLLWTTATAPVRAVLSPRLWAQPFSISLRLADVLDVAETALQTALGLFSLTVLAWTPVLFTCLPGGLFLAWLLFCVGCARVASIPLNGGPFVCGGPWGQAPRETDNVRVFYVAGMGTTSRSLAKTVPRIASVLGHPVAVARPGRTYGVAVDVAYALLQRLVLPFIDLPTPGAHALYVAVRQAMLADRRVVVLAHNTGATVAAQALSWLLADAPPSRLARLEIYTFGSLAPDFVLPISSGIRVNGMSPLKDRSAAMPHLEHFAHVRDPCARFGVLRTVREDLVGRYCGGVFVLGASHAPLRRPVSPLSPLFSRPGLDLHRSVSTASSSDDDSSEFEPLSRQSSSPSTAPPLGGGAHHQKLSSASSLSRTVFRMEDYLTALFGPEPWSMRPDVDGAGEALSAADAHFADAAVVVDRELAEKREMAAMAQSRSGSRSRAATPSTGRLSWTGLGATAADTLGDADGLYGLETVRRLCRECDGQHGRFVSRLPAYYADAASRYHDLFGLRRPSR